jgi:hypothetical protein
MGEASTTCIICQRVMCAICHPKMMHVNEFVLSDGPYCLTCLTDGVFGSNLSQSNMQQIEDKEVKLCKEYNLEDLDYFFPADVQEINEDITSGKALGSYIHCDKFPSECRAFMDNKDGASFK